MGRVWRLFNCPRPSERLCIGVCGYTMLESRFDSYANRVFLLSAWSACCGLLVISQLALATKSFLIIPKSRCVDARDWLVKPTHGLRPNIVWYELRMCVFQCVCVWGAQIVANVATVRQLLTFATAVESWLFVRKLLQWTPPEWERAGPKLRQYILRLMMKSTASSINTHYLCQQMYSELILSTVFGLADNWLNWILKFMKVWRV